MWWYISRKKNFFLSLYLKVRIFHGFIGIKFLLWSLCGVATATESWVVCCFELELFHKQWNCESTLTVFEITFGATNFVIDNFTIGIEWRFSETMAPSIRPLFANSQFRLTLQKKKSNVVLTSLFIKFHWNPP